MAVHDFERRYAEADKPEVQARVLEILARDIDCTRIRRADAADDRRGVDFWASRQCGRDLAIDVKVRRYGWGDVHVELVSRVAERVLGWTVNRTYITDYVLYLWPNNHLLLPFPQLQAAVRRRGADYRLRFPTADAKSKSATSDWATEGVAVPVGPLFHDMFGIGAPYGTPLTPPRLHEQCGEEHPAGTTCADGGVPWQPGGADWAAP